MTNAVLESRRHIPNIALRSAIREWLARHSGHGVVSQSAEGDRDTAEAVFRMGLRSAGEKDDVFAAACFRRAAEQGHSGARYYLAVAYKYGRGVEQDETHAAGLFQDSAEKGHPGAQFALGEYHASDTGAGRNDELSLAWYRKAAEQGVAMAQFRVGVCYVFGRGVGRDALEKDAAVRARPAHDTEGRAISLHNILRVVLIS